MSIGQVYHLLSSRNEDNLPLLWGQLKKSRGEICNGFIDVFRAFSTACYAYANGAHRLYPTASAASARKLAKQLPKAVLMGESHSHLPAGFDFGNLPQQI